jgi:two-component system chemotaxis response regulator CheY
MKRVLNVGQCAMDHGTIRRLIEGHFEASVVPAHSAVETLSQLRGGGYDLVLVNRKLDADGSDGVDVLRAIKADPALAPLPIMLVSNYPDAQQQAEAAGAVPGFGKAQVGSPETLERLRAYLV